MLRLLSLTALVSMMACGGNFAWHGTYEGALTLKKADGTVVETVTGLWSGTYVTYNEPTTIQDDNRYFGSIDAGTRLTSLHGLFGCDGCNVRTSELATETTFDGGRYVGRARVVADALPVRDFSYEVTWHPSFDGGFMTDHPAEFSEQARFKRVGPLPHN